MKRTFDPKDRFVPPVKDKLIEKDMKEYSGQQDDNVPLKKMDNQLVSLGLNRVRAHTWIGPRGGAHGGRRPGGRGRVRVVRGASRRQHADDRDQGAEGGAWPRGPPHRTRGPLS